MTQPRSALRNGARAALAALALALTCAALPARAQAAEPACAQDAANFSTSLVASAVARERAAASGVDAFALPAGEATGTPTSGHAHMLLVRVDFPDMGFSAAESEGALQASIGEGIEGMDCPATAIGAQPPYESVSAYYQRSSYGQLQIEGHVVSYTAAHERSHYTSNVSELFSEVMEGLDASVDFTDYDANGDGVYVVFAGEKGTWASTWWPSMHNVASLYPDLAAKSFDGERLGCVTLMSGVDGRTSEVATLIHETGHMLGLPDYYSYKSQTGDGGSRGIGTDDMMFNNSGDQDAFSKWVLGWIPDESVTRVVVGEDGLRVRRGTGEEETLEGPVDLTVASLASEVTSQPGGLLAISADPGLLGEKGLFCSFYLVQYDQPLGNQDYAAADWVTGLSSAFRVYRVQADLTEDGTSFAKTNAYGSANDMLIECLDPATLSGHEESYACQLGVGDRLTPATSPSTNLREMRTTGYTGIDLTVSAQGGTSGEVRVAYDGSLAPDPDAFRVWDGGTGILARGSYLLSCAYTPALNDMEAGSPRLVVDGREYNCSATVTADGLLVSYDFDPGVLRPGSTCEVVFPEGYFLLGRKDGQMVSSKEMRVSVGVGPVAELAGVGDLASTAVTWEWQSMGLSNVAQTADGRALVAQVLHSYESGVTRLRLTSFDAADPSGAVTADVDGFSCALSTDDAWNLQLTVDGDVAAIVASGSGASRIAWVDVSSGELLAQCDAPAADGAREWRSIAGVPALVTNEWGTIIVEGFVLGADNTPEQRFVALSCSSLLGGEKYVSLFENGAVGYYDADGAFGSGVTVGVSDASELRALLEGGSASDNEARTSPITASDLRVVASLPAPESQVVIDLGACGDGFALASMGYDAQERRQTYTVTTYGADGSRQASAEVGDISEGYLLGIPTLVCGQNGGIALRFSQGASKGVDAQSATVLLRGSSLERRGVLQHRGLGAGAWVDGRWVSVGFGIAWQRRESQTLQYAVSGLIDVADEPDVPVDPVDPVEPTDPDTPSDPSEPDSPDGPSEPAGPKAPAAGNGAKAVPATSDAALPGVAQALLALAGAALAAAGLGRARSARR